MGVLPGVRWALVDWMVHHRPTDHVDVPLPTVLSRCRDDAATDAAVECWTIGEVVRALWDDTTPAPGKVTVLLGLPAGTSFARIARLLDRRRQASPEAPWADLVMQLACRPIRGVATDHVVPSQVAAGDLQDATAPGEQRR